MKKELTTAIVALLTSLFSLYVNCHNMQTSQKKIECITNHIKETL